MHCQYLILLQFVMPKSKTKFGKKTRQLTVQSAFVQWGLPVIIFNKKQHHE